MVNRLHAMLPVLLALAAATPVPAQASRPATTNAGRNEQRALEARKACAAGKTERGIELLAEIIAETGDQNAVYNQARCYQQNGWVEEALVRFREYRRIAKGLSKADRQEVDRYIRELEVERDARAARAAGASAAAAALPANLSQASPAPATGPVPAAVATAPAPSTAAPRRGLAIAALATGATALAAFGAGAYFGWRAERAEHAIESVQQPVDNADFQRTWQRGQRFETWQWVSYATGMVAVAGCTTLFVLHREHSKEAARRSPGLAHAVTVSPAGLGLSLEGRF